LFFLALKSPLTSPNCQVILILDADFPENLFESVLTTLAISRGGFACLACR